jgi:hypothetical protein
METIDTAPPRTARQLLGTTSAAALPALRMVDTIGAAAYTGLAAQTLEILRLKGNGPAYAKLGRSVRYDIADLDTWIDAAKRRSTSQNVG